ncbi:MAG: Fic family protein [Bacilli bacterium]|nr:Fic family protein [Bacilli bacterium]
MENKYTREYLLGTGVGLQDVDHLKTSEYFNKESQRYISGEISLEEFGKLIKEYYKNKPNINENELEADNVSIKIGELIQDDSFTFTVGQFLSIHRYLFEGVFKRAGQTRTYNISKKEWVLEDDSVVYGDYRELEETLQYDFSVEKQFNYSKLSIDQTIERLAIFTANLWQIHVFPEGNTRTVAVFLIKYLRSLGFDVSNDLFRKNAWYFRNALVRANYTNIPKGIYEDRSFLVKFLRNLLLGESNVLENRLLHISLVKNRKKMSRDEKVVDLMKADPKIKTGEIATELGVSLRTAKSIIASLGANGIIERVNGKKYGYWNIK